MSSKYVLCNKYKMHDTVSLATEKTSTIRPEYKVLQQSKKLDRNKIIPKKATEERKKPVSNFHSTAGKQQRIVTIVSACLSHCLCTYLQNRKHKSKLHQISVNCLQLWLDPTLAALWYAM